MRARISSSRLGYFADVRRVVNGRERVWSLGPCASPEDARRLADEFDRTADPPVVLEDAGPSSPAPRRARAPRCRRCADDVHPHAAKDCPAPAALRALREAFGGTGSRRKRNRQ